MENIVKNFTALTMAVHEQEFGKFLVIVYSTEIVFIFVHFLEFHLIFFSLNGGSELKWCV